MNLPTLQALFEFIEAQSAFDTLAQRAMLGLGTAGELTLARARADRAKAGLTHEVLKTQGDGK